jgi:hypothetical protein
MLIYNWSEQGLNTQNDWHDGKAIKVSKGEIKMEREREKKNNKN